MQVFDKLVYVYLTNIIKTIIVNSFKLSCPNIVI